MKRKLPISAKKTPAPFVFVVVVAIGALGLTGGCATFRSGGAPAPTATYGADLSDLNSIEGKAAQLSTFAANPDKAHRDAYIAANLDFIDLRYEQFLQDSSAQRQGLDTIVDFIELSLGVAGTGFSSATAKTILAASSATVSGTMTTIDKNYYYQQTEAALIAAMNGARKQALVPIVTGEQKELKDYGIGSAVTDLHQYYFAGTFLGALEAVQSTSSKSEEDAKTQLKSLVKASSAQIVSKAALTGAIGKIDAAKAPGAIAVITDFKSLRADTADAPIPLPSAISDIQTQLQDIVRQCSDMETLTALTTDFKKEGLL